MITYARHAHAHTQAQHNERSETSIHTVYIHNSSSINNNDTIRYIWSRSSIDFIILSHLTKLLLWNYEMYNIQSRMRCSEGIFLPEHRAYLGWNVDGRYAYNTWYVYSFNSILFRCAFVVGAEIFFIYDFFAFALYVCFMLYAFIRRVRFRCTLVFFFGACRLCTAILSLSHSISFA